MKADLKKIFKDDYEQEYFNDETPGAQSPEVLLNRVDQIL